MLIRLYEKNTSQRDLDRVLDILNGGGVVIFPTDTAYAMGCHALKERPIERMPHQGTQSRQAPLLDSMQRPERHKPVRAD